MIDLTEAHVWDDSGAAALDKIVAKCKEQGIEVELKGLNHASKNLMKQMA
ncbi:permease [Bacillus tequilensis]|nr:permease [Bacillus tequilensis]